MTENEPTHRLLRIFNAALDLEDEERAEYVREACDDDHALAERLLAMLAADAADADDDFLEGSPDGNTPIVWGHYDLIEPIGKGGMGQVFRGRHRAIGRNVAVKVLDAELAWDAGLVSRFMQEAAVVNAVRHPNIIDVTDFIQLLDPPRVAYVMELLSGIALSAAVKAGPLSRPQTLNVAWQILDALEAVHAAGVVHRDLKPDNIFVIRSLETDLSELPSVKILDFGIAQVPTATGHRTATGTVIGTPAYMAPEQASGQRVGPAADVYAWAEIAYEMLTGRRVFPGSATSVLQQKLLAKPPRLDRTLADPSMAPLLDLLERSLIANPAHRPTTAEAKAALHRLGAATGGVAMRTVVATEVACIVTGQRTAPPSIAARIDVAVHKALRAHHGVSESADDTTVATFERAQDAVAFAQTVHRLAADLGAPFGIDTKARAGLWTGQLYLATSNEQRGPVYDGALRLMRLARPGQALMPAVTAGAARRRQTRSSTERPLQWVSHGIYGFEGLPTTVELYEVLEPGAAAAPLPATTAEAWRVGADQEAEWRPGAGLVVPHRSDWVLNRQLGEGGFGEVWLAGRRRNEGALPDEQRIFKFCFGEIPRRALEREARLVARLRQTLGERPDILPVLGSELTHAPYFIEAPYISGGDLKSWVSARGGPETIDVSQRLELVAQVADVLAAAHAVGVLHRDVKPSNILIDDLGAQPRVVLGDFGIGGLLDLGTQPQDGEPPVTAPNDTARQGSEPEDIGFEDTVIRLDVTAAQAGTVMYMPPERLAGRPASLQSDIYAVGVLLYQLVIGDLSRPLTPDWPAGVDDAVLKDDLSAMLAGDPARRLADATEVARRLRTIEARRAEREAAAKEEAAAARARRFRRIAVPLGVVLAVFGAVMTIQAQRIAQEAERANRAAEAARQSAATASRVSDFLIDLFKVSNPSGVNADRVSARELLDKGAARIRTERSEEPLVRSALLEAISKVYVNLGQFDDGRDLTRQALALRESTYGAEHPKVAESLSKLGRLAYVQGNVAEAAEKHARALAIREQTLGADDPAVAESLVQVGWIEHRQGALADAEAKLRRALRIQERAFGDDDRRVASTLERLAINLSQQGRPAAAVAAFRRCLGIYETLWGQRHPRVGRVLHELGSVMSDGLRDTESAEPILRRAASIFEVHEDLATQGATQWTLANNLRDQNKYDEAERWYEAALASFERERTREPGAAVPLPELLADFNRLLSAMGRSSRH